MVDVLSPQQAAETSFKRSVTPFDLICNTQKSYCPARVRWKPQVSACYQPLDHNYDVYSWFDGGGSSLASQPAQYCPTRLESRP